MRLLAVVRLSDLTDENTSPERQTAKITTYANLHDHEVVGLAEDLDVSGAVSLFDRPQLGLWLQRSDDWDGLIVAKYDRLTRSLLDFLVLYKWLQERGKTLIWIDPPLDFSTPFGKAMVNVRSPSPSWSWRSSATASGRPGTRCGRQGSGPAVPSRSAGFPSGPSRTVGS